MCLSQNIKRTTIMENIQRRKWWCPFSIVQIDLGFLLRILFLIFLFLLFDCCCGWFIFLFLLLFVFLKQSQFAFAVNSAQNCCTELAPNTGKLPALRWLPPFLVLFPFSFLLVPKTDGACEQGLNQVSTTYYMTSCTSMGRFPFHGSSFFLPLFPFVRWGSTKILQNPVALVFGRKLPVVRFSSSILSGFQLMQFDAFWQVLGEYLGGKVVKERMGMAWVIMADTCYPSCFNHEVHNIKPCHGNAWFMLFQKVGTTPETWLKIIDTQTWIKMDAVRYTSMTLFFFVASDVFGILQQIKLGVVRVAAVSARQGTSSRKFCHTSSWPMHAPSSSPQLDAGTTSPSRWCYLVFKPLGVQTPINYVLVIFSHVI